MSQHFTFSTHKTTVASFSWWNALLKRRNYGFHYNFMHACDTLQSLYIHVKSLSVTNCMFKVTFFSFPVPVSYCISSFSIAMIKHQGQRQYIEGRSYLDLWFQRDRNASCRGSLETSFRYGFREVEEFIFWTASIKQETQTRRRMIS